MPVNTLINIGEIAKLKESLFAISNAIYDSEALSMNDRNHRIKYFWEIT